MSDITLAHNDEAEFVQWLYESSGMSLRTFGKLVGFSASYLCLVMNRKRRMKFDDLQLLALKSGRVVWLAHTAREDFYVV